MADSLRPDPITRFDEYVRFVDGLGLRVEALERRLAELEVAVEELKSRAPTVSLNLFNSMN